MGKLRAKVHFKKHRTPVQIQPSLEKKNAPIRSILKCI
jgi:hypothetical protein